MAKPHRAPTVRRVVAYCHETFNATGETPSYAMIRDTLGICDNATVRQYVRTAVARGWLELNDDYSGGRGPRRGQRIRLGRPDEADTKRIKMGYEAG